MKKDIEELQDVVIRFAGDSGDGMQLTGTQFTKTTAVLGNDIATLPDYPSEIRAPQGSLAGVSAFQINFSSRDIRTPGDDPNVLVAMNPAALKTSLKDLVEGGILVINEDAFNAQNLAKAGYATNPLEDSALSRYLVYRIPITTMTVSALKDSGISKKEMDRSRNFFALGLMFWLFQRPMDITVEWIRKKFSKDKNIAEANVLALTAGYNYGENAEVIKKHYRIAPAKNVPGTYRNITGNEAAALGFLTAAKLANTPLFYGSYPITPASDILHELSKHKNFGVLTLQAEDEIAAMGATIGASFAGLMALTGTSGPGLSLKSEAMGLAVMTELPMVIANVQRGGPSTGLPTKTEQSDLLQAMYGRHSECPLAVVAPATSADCFQMAVEAFRIAVKFMTPVIYLSDGYLANGTEPWRIPEIDSLPKIEVKHPTDPASFKPYARDEKTLSRPWAIPGTPGLEHRIGGLEKLNIQGTVSHDPANHDVMMHLRAEKIERIADHIPLQEVFGKPEGKVLVVGWGGTYGAITSAVEELQKEYSVSSIHIRYLNPFPKNLGEILSKFETIIVPELNLGQLAHLLRAKYLVEAISFPKVQGQPFKIREIIDGIKKIMETKGGSSWKI
ncbi:MAG: 2-oxoacid:acceptor oxidoreductase subunit alpha [Deltaproteobacteria bacterium]|nr:MAG: 2-oxoacid:acceptor oxidoreductase subunit alpha [Deltaproteobacteria bacterium]